ncbi:MAG: ankyrin repeat domain-containing protein [Verrucomicrobia bacterium]|nr:ankyrin repeat domain-containing protein [Verrucomicrobiota bacterium]
MKTTIATTAAAVLIAGCGAQPVEETTKPDQAAESTALKLAPPKPATEAQPSPAPAPAKPATPPPAPQPEPEPIEPVAAPEAAPTKWEAVKQGNWEAARNGRIDVIKQLLADGLDIEMPDKEGLTAMYRASNNDQKDTVQFLLENGADPNTRDKWGNTPLDVTLSGNIVELLRQHGGKTAEELKAGGN